MGKNAFFSFLPYGTDKNTKGYDLQMNRRESRESVFTLLYETEFRPDEDVCEIYERSCENREIKENKYIKRAYFGVCDKKEELDALIAKHAVGWKPERMQKISRSILRLAIYEMLYMEDIPSTVSINEAIELAKKYDDENARPFINGVLNSVEKSTKKTEANE